MKTLLFISLIIVGISQAFATDNLEKVLARQAAIDRFVHQAPLFIKSDSLPAIRNIGHLKDEIVRTEPNPHIPDKKIEFRTFLFDGLVISGSIRDSEKLALIQIIVTNSQWRIFNDLNVGSSAERIELILGNPTKEFSNIKQYCGETECVKFHLKNNTIEKVELNYYFD